jgi:predicted SAM-dependent methyltransferase
MGKLVRLHVGAGDKQWPGWVNVDLHGEQDVNCDVRKLPFDPNHADEIQAHHVLEHLHRKDANVALADWFRVLKSGGRLVLELPCLDKMAEMIVKGEKNIRLTLLGLFGDPRDERPGMEHKWAYSKAELSDLLLGIGFKDVKVMEPVFHLPPRDMRLEAVKP